MEKSKARSSHQVSLQKQGYRAVVLPPLRIFGCDLDGSVKSFQDPFNKFVRVFIDYLGSKRINKHDLPAIGTDAKTTVN